jgi:hypothetical protein
MSMNAMPVARRENQALAALTAGERPGNHLASARAPGRLGGLFATISAQGAAHTAVPHGR